MSHSFVTCTLAQAETMTIGHKVVRCEMWDVHNGTCLEKTFVFDTGLTRREEKNASLFPVTCCCSLAIHYSTFTIHRSPFMYNWQFRNSLLVFATRNSRANIRHSQLATRCSLSSPAAFVSHNSQLISCKWQLPVASCQLALNSRWNSPFYLDHFIVKIMQVTIRHFCSTSG